MANPIYGFTDRNQQQQNFNPGDNGKPGQPYFVDLVTLEKLFLQTMPMELDYDPQANFVAIASAGRNLAIYHYTGGEDKLEFTFSWYGNDASRQDVMGKVKWLEALTRNDGYDNKPHPVQFIMGDLFRDAQWIVKHAGYKLSHYNRQYGMMPQLASQTIVLLRTGELNRSRADILSIYS